MVNWYKKVDNFPNFAIDYKTLNLITIYNKEPYEIYPGFIL